MKRLTFAGMVVSLVLLAGNALAFPVIDGINTPGEWLASSLFVNAFDVNEGTIPDVYDIKHVAMFRESSGGASDGLYVMFELYGTPTFTSAGAFPVVYLTSLDMNLNGDISAPSDPLPNDAVDRYFDYRLAGFTVRDGAGAAILGSPTYAMGSVVEFYVPSGMFASFPMNAYNTMSVLDNGGFPEDDFIPDRGFNTTVPEPTSMLLFGIGLLGCGRMVRRKFIA